MLTLFEIAQPSFREGNIRCKPGEPFAGASSPDRELVTQASSYDALARGFYDASATLEPIREVEVKP